MSLLGAPELHRRLQALMDVPSRVEQTWAEATAPIIRGYIPHRTGATAASVQATNQGVIGSSVVTFLDKGTKAHDITPKSASVLKFQTRGGTIFRPRAHKPQTRGRDFVEPAGRQGLDKVGTDAIVDTWNGAA